MSVKYPVMAIIPNRHNFYDEFTRGAADATVWTSGGDAGSYTRVQVANSATAWQLQTGGTTDNDRYIHGGSVKENNYFGPFEHDLKSVTWEARVQLPQITDISVFVGLLATVITDYAEPTAVCAHFVVDPAVSANWLARTFETAEEQTDTGVALSTAWVRLKMIWTANYVKFFINDALVATHSTRVPNINMTSELLVRTEADDVKYLRVDYVHVELV